MQCFVKEVQKLKMSTKDFSCASKVRDRSKWLSAMDPKLLLVILPQAAEAAL